MITIGDILRTKRIDLQLKVTAPEEAIYEVAMLLKDDERVNDWNALYSGLISRSPGMAGDGDFEICIPHARTNAVSSMVMAVGRSEAGIVFPKAKRKTSCPTFLDPVVRHADRAPAARSWRCSTYSGGGGRCG